MNQIKKVDFKRERSHLYAPSSKKASIVNVPEMKFIMLDGSGPPEGKLYQEAIQCLYALSFTIKMNKHIKEKIEGFFDYVVPPLEGLWGIEGGEFDFNARRDQWIWTAMIMQPDFITEEIFQEALKESKLKRPELDFTTARLSSLKEGRCIQIMHIGPYSEEEETISLLRKTMEKEGYRNSASGKQMHHEIYLSDPRKAKPENLKTIIRIPIRPA
ncbi:GyrI-like domain-containing protein [Anaeropeptidivorans aminofermentans]|uniref:GyrI-like domain-containing protein n=1 Tax=Anaeropeptidivorans aminofermentans TaxID=2934315 RepID=UPI002024E4FA|nr:GyrI-like domain-containing protein [Anaeropeptidivorans aminofermentans]